MLNNFIYAKSKAMFEERIAEVPNEAIVFIEDTREIWNHGHYFAGQSIDPSVVNNLQTEVLQIKELLNSPAENTIVYDFSQLGNNRGTEITETFGGNDYDRFYGLTADEIQSLTGKTVSNLLSTYSENPCTIVFKDYGQIGEYEVLSKGMGVDNVTQHYGVSYEGYYFKVLTCAISETPFTSDFYGMIRVQVIFPSPEVDDSMSDDSTKPVQNKVVKSYVDENCNVPVVNNSGSGSVVLLSPNQYVKIDEVTAVALDVTLIGGNSGIINNYMFEFSIADNVPVISFPSDLKWMNGNVPTFEQNTTYQISIINGLATVAKFV